MTIFPDYERQLRDLARRGSGDAVQTPRGERALTRWRGRVGQVLPGAIAVLAAIAVLVFAVTVIKHGHGSQPSPAVRPPGGDAEALKYVQAVDRRVLGQGSCRPQTRAVPAVSQGPPNRALLSLLGVLRRSGRPSDALPPPLRHNASQAREMHVNYIRRARVTARVSYYVVPADSEFRGPIFGSSACYPALRNATHAELPHVPPPLRQRVLALQEQQIARLRAQALGGGICLMTNSQFANGGTCGANASDIAGRGMLSVYGYISGIVPDGVASVTLHYRSVRGSVARTITANVIGNVFATSMPQPRGNVRPTITWRSTTGAVVKSIPSDTHNSEPAGGWCAGNARSRPGETQC